MIFLFTGDDIKNKNLSYEKFVKSIPMSEERFSISRNNFDKTHIESLYSGAGLFFSKCIVLFSNIFENEETRDFVLEHLDQFGKSSNSFVFLEGKLTKPILDAFKKVKPEKIEMKIFELPKEKTEKFNSFLLANAFAGKDKLNLWIHFRQAMDKEVSMEELIGVLFWKIKDMILKKDFRVFPESKLKDCASRLSYLLPQARKSGLDTETVLEQFLLEVF